MWVEINRRLVNPMILNLNIMDFLRTLDFFWAKCKISEWMINITIDISYVIWNGMGITIVKSSQIKFCTSLLLVNNYIGYRANAAGNFHNTSCNLYNAYKIIMSSPLLVKVFLKASQVIVCFTMLRSTSFHVFLCYDNSHHIMRSSSLHGRSWD